MYYVKSIKSLNRSKFYIHTNETGDWKGQSCLSTHYKDCVIHPRSNSKILQRNTCKLGEMKVLCHGEQNGKSTRLTNYKCSILNVHPHVLMYYQTQPHVVASVRYSFSNPRSYSLHHVTKSNNIIHSEATNQICETSKKNHTKRKVHPAEINLIKKLILEEFNSRDASQLTIHGIYKTLQFYLYKNMPHIPSKLIYHSVRNAFLRLESRKLSQAQREDVVKFVNSWKEQHHIDLNQICKEISNQLHIPTTQSYSLVLKECRKRNRNKMNKNLKQNIRLFLNQFIRHKSDGNIDLEMNSVSELCDMFQRDYSHNISRSEIYYFMCEALSNYQRKPVLKEQRDTILQLSKQFSNVEGYSISDKISLIQKEVNLPKQQIRELYMASKIRKENNAKSLTEYQMTIITSFLDDNKHLWDDISQMCLQLQHQIPLPESNLKQILRGEVRKRSEIHLSSSQLELITLIIKSRDYYDITEIRDVVHDRFPELPRHKLYRVIQNEVQKYIRKLINKDHRRKVKEMIQLYPDEETSKQVERLYDLDLPRPAIIYLINYMKKKKKTKE